MSTILQQKLTNNIDGYCNLWFQNSDRRFMLRDMLIDAALCLTLDEDIVKKIQQKYDLHSVIQVFYTHMSYIFTSKMNICVFPLLEAVI